MLNHTVAILFAFVVTFTQGSVLIPDVAYGSHPDQIMDIYLPSNDTTRVSKVAVLIHGGSWHSGDKDQMMEVVEFLETFFPDICIVNINFRPGNHSSPGFPKQLEDIDAVVAYIQNTFTQTVTFAMFGTSSGGHLATLYGYSWDKVARNVKVIVTIVGPSDLTDPAYDTHSEWERFFNFVGPCRHQECPDQYIAASPVYHVDADSPKTIGFFGTLDFLIPPSQMYRLRDKLDEAGVVNKFTLYPGGHWDNWSDENKADTVMQITQFFNEHWQ